MEAPGRTSQSRGRSADRHRTREWRRQSAHPDRRAAARWMAAVRSSSKNCSVKLFGIGPSREAGHDVECSEELSHDLLRVSLCAEMVELAEDARDRTIRIGD